MLNRATVGTSDDSSSRSRVFEAAFTFAMSGALLLASASLMSHSLAARPRQGPPIPGAVVVSGTFVVPDQHRGPAPRIVHVDPRPFTPVSAPAVSGPGVARPAVSAPIVSSPGVPVERMEPLRIDPAERQQIVARHADEMKREHCLRKLEARQRALRERNANH